MSWIIIVVAVALLALIGFLLDREIYFYEGVHLGPRLQAWLYDRWSKKYDEGKRESQLHDDTMLAQPLLEAFHDISQPFILDFATGTGRLSCALVNRADFKGTIVALDLSEGMLKQASLKLRSMAPAQELPVEFLRHLALPLPFPDASFDAVCAIEVLELFPEMDEPLAELARVLRPGGILLTSRGTEESGRRAKIKSSGAFSALLEKHGMEQIRITRWWKLFDRVLAVKAGKSAPVAVRALSQILKCSSCHFIDWVETADHWRCRRCGSSLSVTPEMIVLN